MPPVAKKADTGPIVLKRLEDMEIEIPIEGITEVIPHAWSEKALRMMRDKQFGRPKTKHEPKNPEEEAQMATYWLPNGEPGMPATAFKAATVEACRFFDKPSMTEARRMLFVVGEGPDQLVQIKGPKRLREDTPRNAGGTVDLRYRYAYFPWTATLIVRFLPSQITPESVLALVDAGGRCGVGDWRPGAPKSNTGTFGTYRVVGEAREVTT